MSEHEHLYDFFGLDWPRAVDEDFDALPPVITLECACGRFLSEQEIIRRVNAYDGMKKFIAHMYSGELDGIDEMYPELPEDVLRAIEDCAACGDA